MKKNNALMWLMSRLADCLQSCSEISFIISYEDI